MGYKRPWVVESLVALLFALTVAGYPIAGLLAAGFDLPSQATSVPFRLLVVGLATLIALMTMSQCKIRKPVLFLLGFWVSYLLRLVWDAAATDLQGADSALTFFVAVVVVPCIALIVGTRSWRDELAAKLLFAIGGVVSFSALALEWSGLAAARSLTEATSRLSTDTLNPITLGHVAVSVLLAAYCLLDSWKRLGARLVLAAVSAASVVCLLQTGSKGPLISLAAAVVFLFVIGKARPSLLIMLVCVSSAGLYFSQTPITERLFYLGQDESTAQRIRLADDALQQILSNPSYGSAFVELNSQTYPHNLVIEAMMALGIPLGLLFVSLCLYGLWRAFRLRRLKTTFLALIFVQYFVAALLSGSLYGSAGFWASLALLINLAKPSATRQQRSATIVCSSFRRA